MRTLHLYLRGYGYGEVAAAIHSAFLQSAVRLLAEAHRSLTSPTCWEVFTTLDGAMGKTRSRGRHTGYRLPDEIALSQELWRRMSDIYGNAPQMWPTLLQHRTQIHHDPPIMTGNRRGKKARRSDIEIGAASPRGPAIVIEAKVIEEAEHVAKRMLGRDGIGCFLGEEAYAGRGDFGGLLGYVVSDRTTDWSRTVGTAYGSRHDLDGRVESILLTPPGLEVQIAPIRRPGLRQRNILMVNLLLHFERQAAH